MWKMEEKRKVCDLVGHGSRSDYKKREFTVG